MRALQLLVIALLALVVACAPAERAPAETAHRMTGADVALHMNDGRVLYGVVESDDADSLYLETSQGRVAARKQEIARVELFTSATERKRGLGAGGAVAIALAALLALAGALFLIPLLFSNAHF